MSGGKGWTIAFVASVVVSCGGDSLRSEDTREPGLCSSDADCESGVLCVAKGEGSRDTLALPPTCMSTNQCAGNSNCGPGQVCNVTTTSGNCPPSRRCVDACEQVGANPCADGYACGPGGSCDLVRCDDVRHPGCPTGMACDPFYEPALEPTLPPGRRSLFGTDVYPPEAMTDAGPQLDERQTRAVVAGCYFLRCDESGAFNCRGDFECDVERAETTGSGCVPISCDELGRCWSEQYVCEPTSEQERPSGADPFGCVARLCDEGLECPELSVCDFSRPGLSSGCAYLRCDKDGVACPTADTFCEPEPEPLPSGRAPYVDPYGCTALRCDLHKYECPDGKRCEGENSGTDAHGCAVIPPEPPIAGGGGVGGAGAGTGGGVQQGGTAPVSAGSGSTGSGAGETTGTCTSGDECPGRYCVSGSCSDSPGTCSGG